MYRYFVNNQIQHCTPKRHTEFQMTVLYLYKYGFPGVLILGGHWSFLRVAKQKSLFKMIINSLLIQGKFNRIAFS